MYLSELRCTVCDRAYEPVAGRMTCDDCGQVGTLDARYDDAAIASVMSPSTLADDREPSMWRYRPLLPVAADTPVSNLSVGGTPLIEAPRLASRLGMTKLSIKDEAREPTASLKDRASAVALARAAQEGADVVTTASTGNAAAALAGLAASTGQRAVIFVPESAPEAKVAQLLAFGATVVLVEGTYDAAFDLCTTAAERWGWYNRNTGVNPYVAEGKKTVSLEIAEQSGWDPPDAVIVSVGDGSIIGGVAKGFHDARRLGWIDRMPRILGIQAAGSSYLADAAKSGEDVVTKPAIRASTAADSISADLPKDRVKAINAVASTGGSWITVTDEEILAMIPVVGATSGVFAEPAAAAGFAGLAAAIDNELIDRDDRVVVISTGSGLKDVRGVMEGTRINGITPMRVAPGPSALDTIERGMTQ